jgi:hypothetical protein
MGRICASTFLFSVPFGTLLEFNRAGWVGGGVGFAAANCFSLLITESSPVRWESCVYPPDDEPPSSAAWA